MSNTKIILTEKDKKALYSGIAILFVAVALAVMVFQYFAFHRSALRSCTSILLPQNRQQCLQNLALYTGNASVCNYALGQGKYECLANFAESSNSLSDCQAINHSSPYYSLCVYNISYSSESINGCELIPNSSYSSACIYSIAKKLGFESPSYCSGIRNTSLKNTCLYMYDFNAANAYENISYCSLLPNGQNSTLLYLMASQASGFGSSSPGYGVTLPLYYYVMNATPKSVCFYSLAVKTKNPSLCSYIGGSLSATCSYVVKASMLNLNESSNLTLNSSSMNASIMCNSTPSYLKGYCMAGIETTLAIKERNVGVCLNMSSTTFSYPCIEALARTYADPSYCDYIQNATVQSACLLSSGKINLTT
ncbi:MAG: hypothetical protein ACP5SJ_01870 [Candidatus Micrarchaeia archaeon]